MQGQQMWTENCSSPRMAACKTVAWLLLVGIPSQLTAAASSEGRTVLAVPKAEQDYQLKLP